MVVELCRSILRADSRLFHLGLDVVSFQVEPRDPRVFGQGLHRYHSRAAVAVREPVNQQGTIYFPPGQYRLTRPVTLLPGGAVYDLRGSASTVIQGNFDGYLFDSPDWNGDGYLRMCFKRFIMSNFSLSPSAGCIRFNGGIVCKTEECVFTAWRPITLINIYQGAVRDCVFRPPGALPDTAGVAEKASIGIMSDFNNNLSIEDCDFNGFYEAIRGHAGFTVRNTRIEMCYRGVVVGMDQNNSPAGAMCTLNQMTMEANTYHIILSGAYLCTISNIGILGDPFSVAENPHTTPNTTPGQVGILIQSAVLLNMQSVTVTGEFQDAGIKFEQPPPNSAVPFDRCVFSAVNVELDPNAVAWRGLEFVDRNRVTFIQCNNP